MDGSPDFPSLLSLLSRFLRVSQAPEKFFPIRQPWVGSVTAALLATAYGITKLNKDRGLWVNFCIFKVSSRRDTICVNLL